MTVADFVAKGVPRSVARALLAEAHTLDLLFQGGRLRAEAARAQIRRLAVRLAGLEGRR